MSGIADAEWARAVGLVRAAGAILLCTHQKPDGDAIGSLLGLGTALEDAGKRVTLACADAPQNALAQLPGAEQIVSELSGAYSAADDVLPWDLIICLDASDPTRLGALYERHRDLFDRLPIVDLDHHVTNSRFGAANLVDPSAAAAAEVVTHFLQRLSIAPSERAATCLLAGILTDSLSFQTESTSARTLRTAAVLLEAGAPLSRLAHLLFRQRPLGSALVWSKALGTLRFAAGGRIAWIEVPREMVESSGPGADTSGLSGFAGSIAGVDIGFIVEEGADGNVYAGLRSQTIDVAQIAAHFGGGGHQRAAGCHFPPPATLAEGRTRLLAAIEAALEPDQSVCHT
jgi:phosphoesterase RecJ-like protein